MKTRIITVRELPEYLDSEEFRRTEVVPISRTRALSHVQNPRAKPEDLALVLVYVDDKMEAYLGVLPDLIYPRGQAERCGWLSCMWVNPQLRGKGIAKLLINTVFEHWDRRILVTEFTPEAKGLYDSTKQFLDLHTSDGIRGYFRPRFAALLPNRNPKWGKFKGLLHLVDAVLGPLNRVRLLFLNAFFETPGVSVEYLPEMDADSWRFVEARQEGEFMRRQWADFKWIARNPWLLSGADPDDVARRYHFTAVVRDFRFFNIKVVQNGQIIGFLMLSLRDGSLRVPYAYFDDEHLPLVAKIIYRHLLRLGAHTLTLYHARLAAYLFSNKTPFFMKRPFKRKYIISKVFENGLFEKPIVIQDGDADAAFT